MEKKGRDVLGEEEKQHQASEMEGEPFRSGRNGKKAKNREKMEMQGSGGLSDEPGEGVGSGRKVSHAPSRAGAWVTVRRRRAARGGASSENFAGKGCRRGGDPTAMRLSGVVREENEGTGVKHGHWTGASFLANVRENSEKHSDILQLQRQLLDDIDKGKNRKIRSRILITTRNKHLLHVDKYHEIEELNSEEALQLFSLYAFKPTCHQEDYEDLPDRIVKYAKGLPLALQVWVLTYVRGHQVNGKVNYISWKENQSKKFRMGTEAIKGIFLDMSTSKQLQFTTEAFKMMNDLRLLKVHQDANYDSAELRYLHWDGYPLESLPSNFYAENLVELNLRCSNIKQLWETELFKELKVINLSHSKHLSEIPNPSSVPNLEILTLEGCINLESLPRSIYKLRRLKTLCCGGCKNLRSFPEIMGNMEKLRKLDLDNTAIVKLPSSIEHLKGLEYLDLSNCKDLITVPQSICNLTSLKFLNLDFCSNLKSCQRI
ncbi:putative disease resistance protein RPP1 [Vitis vinifera]|uniref:Putative disease resistance protein RPP1 n=1 Tax=Vitis vinifera TaxID=29760 RepID=A0A438CCF5_VITVI|nr:putative disease resistance protein RPP1 [Vitis vinifera]